MIIKFIFITHFDTKIALWDKFMACTPFQRESS